MGLIIQIQAVAHLLVGPASNRLTRRCRAPDSRMAGKNSSLMLRLPATADARSAMTCTALCLYFRKAGCWAARRADDRCTLRNDLHSPLLLLVHCRCWAARQLIVQVMLLPVWEVAGKLSTREGSGCRTHLIRGAHEAHKGGHGCRDAEQGHLVGVVAGRQDAQTVHSLLCSRALCARICGQ